MTFGLPTAEFRAPEANVDESTPKTSPAAAPATSADAPGHATSESPPAAGSRPAAPSGIRHRRRLMQRMRPFAAPLAGSLTVLVAVWGAITGTIAWRENRKITVNVAAGTYSGFFPLTGIRAIGTDEFRVTIVNTSARAISLVKGDVLLAGAVVGHVVSATPDAPVLNGQLGQASTVPLPLTVSSDSSSRLGLDWRATPSAFQKLLAATRLPIPRRSISLRLMLEPGGTRTVVVHTGDQPPIIGGWNAMVVVRQNRVRDIVMMAAARSSGATEGTLKMWRSDPGSGNPMLTLRRPAAWNLPGWFSVSSLPTGSYLYTLSVAGRVVGTGVVQTRCTGADNALYYATACNDGTADVQPFVKVTSPPGVPSPRRK